MKPKLIIEELSNGMFNLTSTGTGVQNISDHKIYSAVVTSSAEISNFRAV